MSVYKCTNKECEKFHIEVTIPKIRYILRNGEFVPYRSILCKNCRHAMEFVKDSIKPGVPEYNRFGSLSDEEKKRVLKKRSDEHYRKKGKEKKREYFKNAMRRMTDE